MSVRSNGWAGVVLEESSNHIWGRGVGRRLFGRGEGTADLLEDIPEVGDVEGVGKMECRAETPACLYVIWGYGGGAWLKVTLEREGSTS